MTVKELLEQVTFKNIIFFISKNIGEFNYEDYMALSETFDLLTNKDELPLNPEIPAKYSLELMVALKNSLPEKMESFRDAIAASYYSLIGKGNRKYTISERYVKSVADFSACEVRLSDNYSLEECAFLLTMSFAVLNHFVTETYNIITPMEYYLIISHRPVVKDEEDNEADE